MVRCLSAWAVTALGRTRIAVGARFGMGCHSPVGQAVRRQIWAVGAGGHYGLACWTAIPGGGASSELLAGKKEKKKRSCSLTSQQRLFYLPFLRGRWLTAVVLIVLMVGIKICVRICFTDGQRSSVLWSGKAVALGAADTSS